MSGLRPTHLYAGVAAGGLLGLLTAAGPAAASATTLGPPSAPRSVWTTTKTNTLVIRWKAPASDGGSAITQYDQMCTSTDGAGPLGGAAPGTARTTMLSGLPPNVTYRCTVTATNASGTSPAGVSADYAEHAVSTSTVRTSVMHVPVRAGQSLTLKAGGEVSTSDGCFALTIRGPSGATLAHGACLFKHMTVSTSTAHPFTTAGTATAALTPPDGASGSAELVAYS